MDPQVRILVLLLGLLLLLMWLLWWRFTRVTLRRKPPPPKLSDKHDLLVDALKAQAQREREANASRVESVLALEALDELHRGIMQHLPVGVAVLRASGSLQYANPRFMNLFGLDNIVGQDLQAVSPAVARAFVEMKDTSGDIWLRPEINGVVLYLHLALNSLQNGMFLLTAVDETRMRKLEERLRYKRDIELMGEMASGIAHEVKNSLAVIQGHVQLLAYDRDGDHGPRIMSEVERLLKFVREFMRSSRGEEVDRAPIDVPTWLASLEEHWAGHPHGDKVVVAIPDSHETPISGDVTLLTVMVNNLVLNGLEACEAASPPGPWVTISVVERAGEVLLTVMDQGPGFTPEIRKKMFIPFVSSKEKGTGLGLFHCRRIMLEHLGQLEVAPELPTRIICHFPKV